MEKSTSNAQLAVTPQHAPIAPGSGTGSALFVINLCASIAPVRLDGNNIPGLENYRLYQVARNEDGRTRHRLRLGFFTSESHAQSVLTVVRQQYPTAFTTSLCEEDRRFTR
ncbi:MAG: SPOR domain-containing protein, partial [Steroidobacteraceae bacterium]